MRERTTWNRKLIATRMTASDKVAEDPRAMNQDHLSQQPSADKYEIGGPSDFAEDVHPSNGTWKAEYSGGEVKRNEIGMPEMRGDTYTHAEKTAADDQQEQDDEVLEKKADLCIKLAKKVLTKTASESMIEDQAVAFMHMPDTDLIESVNRLAAEEDEQEEQQKQAQQQQSEKDEQQQKQAQQQQQQAEKDEQQAKQAQQQQQQADKDEQQKQAQAQQQQQQADEEKKQAGQIPENFLKKKDEDKGDDEEQKKQAAFNLFKQACDAMAQGMGMPQDQVMALFQQALSGQQQQQPQQVQQQQMGDDQLLDQMLQDDGQQPVMANLDDIQLEGASMDTGEIKLGSEDEVLNTLFASHEEVRNANHANQLQYGTPVPQQGTTRTASTRTVGTRPTAGVSQLGSGSNVSSGGDVDKLSSLWQSAPDIRGIFS